ncbi:MAG: hypothetical protein KDC09_09460 [Bacteroidales bacterium]|nr:hypothetical protein [Bacteroidales bacterium]
MYQSSTYSYVNIKFIPLIIGLLFIVISIWIMFDPTIEITVNGVKRNAALGDSFFPLLLGLLCILFHLAIGHKIIKLRISNNELEFMANGKKYVKKWSEVSDLKKYWLIAPPLYSIKFKNEKKTYYFTTSYFCIVTPIKVFDLSEMGNFIKKKKSEILMHKD